MMFYRINEHTVSCVIGENEITQMGYHIDQLYQDKEIASKFMKEVCGKAKEIGFHIGNNVQAVQVALSQNHQMILNFIEINPEEQIDTTIQNLLGAADTVDFIGRDKLEAILDLKGDEKAKAFNECMAEIEDDRTEQEDSNLLESPEMKERIVDSIAQEVGRGSTYSSEDEDFINNQQAIKKASEVENTEDGNDAQQNPTEETTIMKPEIYMLKFTELSKVEEFCKDTSFEVPGRLYKDRSQYIMMVDLGTLDLQKKGGFIFQAEEYTSDITKGNTLTTYLEEHAETLIEEKPIEVLKKL